MSVDVSVQPQEPGPAREATPAPEEMAGASEPAPADRPGPPGRALRHRLRLLAGCLLLAAVAFNTAPGAVISETKLDMAVNPLGFLSRALHLWDPAYFGHLQNQAYGYLFPMGPFYVLFRAMDMPAWDIQRLWMSLVLCAAFLGTERLARAMGIGSPGTRILGALAYALAPHALALIGINSSEFQPSAVLPWVLLPLVHGTREGASPRRAAALSAAAFLFAGGVNAAAELAVLVVPLVYLLSRRQGGRTWALLGWWLLFVGLVSMWWLVPLLLLGRYIFSFLPFIETASATTSVTSLVNALRGTSSWISFLPVDGQPWLPAAYDQATVPWLVAATALVAGLGLTGVVRRATPERTFLVLCVIAGLLLVTAGHAGDLAHPWTGQVRDLLDGPLAPFRNLHKFDALIRLPLALGLAALPVAGPVRLRRPVTALAAGLLALTIVPVATAGVTARGSFADLPTYWREAAAWLNRNAGDGMVLAMPGSARGEYLWGRPLDEPMQSLLTVRWATHANVPWGSPGLARLVQAVDERFATGHGSPGLTEALRRAGVTYLLIRNDLVRETLGTAWPARVHQTLQDSGLSRTAEFGPLVGLTANGTASGWLDQPYPALEVYKIAGTAPLASTVPRAGTLHVEGAPEAVLDMAEEGLLTGDRPVLVGDEPGAAAIPARDTILTDTLRKRDIVFGDVRRIASATLTGNQAPVSTDLTDPAWSAATSTARYLDVKDVTASSADSAVTAAVGQRDPGRQPYAALDEDPRTGWRSDGWHGAVGEWLEVRFTGRVDLTEIAAAFEQGAIGPPVAEVALETERGARRVAVARTDALQPLRPVPGKSSWLRIKVTRLAYEPRTALGSRAGITDLRIPGVRAVRTISVPDTGTGDPGTVLLTKRGDADACMRGSVTWTCSSRLQIIGEDGYGFDRLIPVARDGVRTVRGQAVLADPKAADLITTLPNQYPHVSASSTATEHGAVLGRQAMDGDPSTLWFAQPFDRHPTLSIDLGRTRTFSRIRVLFPDSAQGIPPVKLTLRAGAALTETRAVQGWVDRDGVFTFPALKTRKFTIEFTAPASRAIEVAEIAIPGVKPLGGLGAIPLRLPCGYGPTLRVDGDEVPTRVVGGTLDDVLNGRPLTYSGCAPVHLTEGRSRVGVAPSDAFRVRSVMLDDGAGEDRAAVTATPATVTSWGPQERRLRVTAAAPSYLVVNENYNAGWQAYLDGVRLTPARLDGWRQAWELPAGGGEVVLRYEPDPAYRIALLAGLGLALAVVALALVRGRSRLRPVGPGRVRTLWVWIAAPIAGLLAGGVAGVVVVAAALAAFLWLRGIAGAQHAGPSRLRAFARHAASAWVALVALGLAGLAQAAGQGPAADVLCLVVLARLLAAVRDQQGEVAR
ncbi:alpha-(1-_3)-arabinofuranosyltransferase family protein [Microbispora sp. NBRC 16548]|uniref:alpha-(1->3)-arabinofuranosyltransferase domain-containing protein n=1 Tax=Microbispora sp. NBRC 16548 TaxID=3030994 RepID=UPI0024A566F5|nr:alpha-(1->3)-arabinofuranosyltransferase family protein [Microbispora sp. NBRC 16548]GLX04488.1 coagulation factor 5/8 type [Microbispora sp. NBRC 16548]